MNTQEILTQFGLDFTISKRALSDNNGNESGYFGLWNDKENVCINTVKEGYHVSQNKDVIDLVLEGIKPFDTSLSVQKAGAINEGRKVFLQLAIEGDGNINGDRIKRYVTVIDSNDGSTGLSIGFGDLTMSCQNQFFKFYKAGEAKFRHTASIEQRIKEIPSLIETALSESFKQMEIYRHLAETSIHGDIAHRLVKELMGFDKKFTSIDDLSKKSTRSINIMENIYECIDVEMKDKGQNLWGLHSGVTKYTTHNMKKPNRENGDYEALLLGRGYKYNDASLNFVTNQLRKELVLS